MKPFNSLALSTILLGGACSIFEPTDSDGDQPIAQEIDQAIVETRDGAEQLEQSAREAMGDADRALDASTARILADLGLTKEEFATNSKRRLEAVDREFEELADRARAAGVEVDRDLERARKELDTFADEVDQASEDAWEDSKGKFAEGLTKLEASIHKAREHVEQSS